jgi:hypothetical protein
MAWVARSAIALALAAILFAIIWFLLMPLMIEGLSDVLRNSTR